MADRGSDSRRRDCTGRRLGWWQRGNTSPGSSGGRRWGKGRGARASTGLGSAWAGRGLTFLLILEAQQAGPGHLFVLARPLARLQPVAGFRAARDAAPGLSAEARVVRGGWRRQRRPRAQERLPRGGPVAAARAGLFARGRRGQQRWRLLLLIALPLLLLRVVPLAHVHPPGLSEHPSRRPRALTAARRLRGRGSAETTAAHAQSREPPPQTGSSRLWLATAPPRVRMRLSAPRAPLLGRSLFALPSSGVGDCSHGTLRLQCCSKGHKEDHRDERNECSLSSLSVLLQCVVRAYTKPLPVEAFLPLSACRVNRGGRPGRSRGTSQLTWAWEGKVHPQD